MSGRLECCCWRHLQADSTESSAQGAVRELTIEAIATNAFDCQAQFCTHYRGPLLTCCCCCAEAVDALAGRNRAGSGLPVIGARVCNLAGRLMVAQRDAGCELGTCGAVRVSGDAGSGCGGAIKAVRVRQRPRACSGKTDHENSPGFREDEQSSENPSLPGRSVAPSARRPRRFRLMLVRRRPAGRCAPPKPLAPAWYPGPTCAVWRRPRF